MYLEDVIIESHNGVLPAAKELHRVHCLNCQDSLMTSTNTIKNISSKFLKNIENIYMHILKYLITPYSLIRF